MSKTETARQLSAAATAQRLSNMTAQIETLRQAKQQSAEELASTLEPLAQAMATLVDETRQSLSAIEQTSQQQSAALEAATQEARNAALNLTQATQGLEWRHYALTILTGLITAGLVSGFWLWLSPPQIENRLDPKAVAEHLQPALIEALRPSDATPPR